MRRIIGCVAVVGLLSLCVDRGSQPSAAEPAREPVDFNRDIRPILARNCFACHGQDNTHRAAKLRLDQRDSAVKKLKSGHTAIVPGKAEASELLSRVTATDETERMPPKETNNHVKRGEVELLRRWIAEGAPYAEHWAFVKPKQSPLPVIKEKSWPRNGIDYFILAELEKHGLKPAGPADKFALLRRASLELRGLPPTPREVETFAADNRPDAYEHAVDRFLNDSAYGERWARMWLDQARYADSAGYGSDPLRPNIWRWRDWVIEAFNRNLPYDQFTIEQLAGDLLPNPTLDQRIATAFHRNTMTNTEGGTDDEEFRVAAVKDRIDTTMQVWMGVTLGCAKCHSHKFDPITHKEYYSFFALFNQTTDNDQPDERPTLAAPSKATEELNRRLDLQLAALRKQLDIETPQLAAARTKWAAELKSEGKWIVLEPLSAQAEGGATLKVQPDRSLRVEGARPANDVYTIAAKSDLKGLTAFRLETIPDAGLPAGGAGRADDGNFVLSRLGITASSAEAKDTRTLGRFVRVEIPGPGKLLSLAEVQVFSNGTNVARSGSASQSSTDYEGAPARAIDGNTNGDYSANSVTHTNTEANPWWEVKLSAATAIDSIVVWNRTDGGTGTRLAQFRVSILDDSRKVVWQTSVVKPPNPKRALSPSGKLEVTLSQALADHSQPQFAVADALNPKNPTKNGWAVAPQIKAGHSAVFVAAAPVGVPAPVMLTFRLSHRYHLPYFTLGRFRLSATNDPRVLRRAQVPAEVLAIIDLPAEKRTGDQQAKLAAFHRTVAPELQTIRAEIAKLEKTRATAPLVPVMVELPTNQRRQTFIQIKGNFLTRGDKVDAGLPAYFPPLPKGAPLDRLGVARWLTAADNPLTARVAVNRFWAQVFGAGLVRTEEDFGTQGEFPSHPQLLDWLALEFMQRKWDMKALLKLLVTSATYRQTARVTPEILIKDSTNRLLSRGPRFRLEAEMVRDQALALSGLLSRKVGGPSVYPPQPPGLWQAAFNGQRNWPTSTGADRYRRGLYTFWRRTVPYPSMATFDAPSREICTARRVRTNTPLQAFVTMNDPCFVEMSQALARRIARDGGANAEDRARFGLKLCLCRPPQPEQVRALVKLYESEVEHYRRNPKEAMAMATDPLGPLPEGMHPAELAAWTVVANVLLNMDAVLMKG